MRKHLFLVLSLVSLVCVSQNIADEIDLGLSVKWASHNIGAKAPQDYGWYLAWGEVSEKKTYDKDNYKYKDDKSLEDITSTKLDMAKQLWKGSWRLPTKEEAEELQEKCTWKWKEIDGVLGVQATGPNGNSIFFPAGGEKNGKTKHDEGDHCYYWTGSVYKGFTLGDKDAWPMMVYNINPKMSFNLAIETYWGLLVRPVAEYTAQDSNKRQFTQNRQPQEDKKKLFDGDSIAQLIEKKTLNCIMQTIGEVDELAYEHGQEVSEKINKDPFKSGNKYVFKLAKQAPDEYIELFTTKLFTTADWKNWENHIRENYHQLVMSGYEKNDKRLKTNSKEEQEQRKRVLDAYAYKVADRFYIPNYKALFIKNMYYEQNRKFYDIPTLEAGYIDENCLPRVLETLVFLMEKSESKN